jgi:hypothetical protein
VSTDSPEFFDGIGGLLIHWARSLRACHIQPALASAVIFQCAKNKTTLDGFGQSRGFANLRSPYEFLQQLQLYIGLKSPLKDTVWHLKWLEIGNFGAIWHGDAQLSGNRVNGAPERYDGATSQIGIESGQVLDEAVD